MAEYFLAQAALGGGSTPATTNDGRDRFGWNLSTATWDRLSRELTMTGAWASYTWTAGDRIYLTHATEADALVEIEAKVSNDVIRIVEQWSTSNRTLVGSSNGAWGDSNHRTAIQYMHDTMATGGDYCWICRGASDAAWTPTGATIDLDLQVGLANGDQALHYWGANERGTPDGVQTVIDAVGMTTGADLFTYGGGNVYHSWKDLRFTRARRHAIVTGLSPGIGYTTWRNVRTDNSVDSGWFARFSYCSGYKCEWDHNGQMGWENTGTWGSNMGYFLSCLWHHNGTTTAHHGMSGYSRSPVVYIACEFYRNAGSGLRNVSTDYYITTVGCVFCWNGRDGWEDNAAFNSGQGNLLSTNIFYRNGRYGLSYAGIWIGPAGDNGETLFDFNCFYLNSSGDLFPTNMVLGPNTITTDPLFVSDIDGSEDWSLQAGSPCSNAGGMYP